MASKNILAGFQGAHFVVTGGAGFIGSHLVDRLAPIGRVTVLDDLSSGSLANIAIHLKESDRVKFIEGDIRDVEVVRKALQGADVVFHLAVRCLRLSFREPEVVHDVNATGTLRVLQAAKENGVSRFVYVSSSEVYGSAVTVPMAEDHSLNPTTIYGASKLAGEHYALAFFRTYDLPVSVVRPFNTYGPRAHFEGAYGEVIPKFTLRSMGGKPPVIFGDGEQTRDFTYVTDVVEGICLAASAEALIGKVVNIARGEEVKVAEIARLILEATGQGNLRSVFEQSRPADVRRHWADISRARELVGFDPQVEIGDGIRRYVEWVREQNIDLDKALAAEVRRNW